MKRYSTPAISSRRLALGLLSALVLLVVALRGGGWAPTVVHAAPPAISVNEVDQSPATSVGTIPLGTVVTWTVHITLSSGQAAGMSIALNAQPNIGPARTVNCGQPIGAPSANSSTGTPSCGWPGPIPAGAYTLTFFGPANGPITAAVPFATSRVCTDTGGPGGHGDNSCTGEAPGDVVALLDSNGDVGPLSVPSVPAAPTLSVNEVSQLPAGGSSVSVGTIVTYTVNLTLSSPMPTAQSLSIQLKADANINPTLRTASCTSSAGPATTSGTGGATASCFWHYPVTAGTYQMVFQGPITGPIGDPIPDALSVVCDDTDSTNTCGDEAPALRVALVDSNNDVGPLSIAAGGAPVATGEVNQTPLGGTSQPAGTLVTYTTSVNLTVAQAQSVTIQLKGDAGLGSRMINCAAVGNGAPAAAVATGNPACRWAGPVAVGTFTMTVTGTLIGSIGDAVPDPISVICTDINNSNACDDEPPAAKVALTDANNDVGPLTVPGSGPAVTSEVDQTPAGGGTPAVGSTVTYSVNVTLTAAQAQSLTIQLKADANLGSRTINCSSIGNPAPVAAVASGNPACRWAGPVAVGTFTMTFSGQLNGAIGDAVPDPVSVACFDVNNSTSCDDELPAAKAALADANGDVGPLTVAGAGTPPSATSEVGQTPVGGSTVASGTHVVYTAQVVLTAPQTQAMTIQLRGDANLINRVLTCTSSNAGNATTVATAGNPSCMWAGPLSTGTTFFFTFSGDLSGSIGDAVPDSATVVCTDTNANNTCGDEGAAVIVPLADANGDVGPLTVQNGPTKYRLVVTQVAADGITP